MLYIQEHLDAIKRAPNWHPFLEIDFISSRLAKVERTKLTRETGNFRFSLEYCLFHAGTLG